MTDRKEKTIEISDVKIVFFFLFLDALPQEETFKTNFVDIFITKLVKMLKLLRNTLVNSK